MNLITQFLKIICGNVVCLCAIVKFIWELIAARKDGMQLVFQGFPQFNVGKCRIVSYSMVMLILGKSTCFVKKGIINPSIIIIIMTRV